MGYFAGLDVSMEETHICILDREGVLVREGKASSTPKMIAAFLTDGPICAKVVFETGRMAPMLYHGLAELGAPVACIESRHPLRTRGEPSIQMPFRLEAAILSRMRSAVTSRSN